MRNDISNYFFLKERNTLKPFKANEFQVPELRLDISDPLVLFLEQFEKPKISVRDRAETFF